jgi:Calcium-dependent channel, 7TM region, putative phosphate
VLLALIYVFYTIPLAAASTLVNPSKLSELFPRLGDWSEKSGTNIANLVSGAITAIIWSGFFSVCPIMFISIANSGSGATSKIGAEFCALQYCKCALCSL